MMSQVEQYCFIYINPPNLNEDLVYILSAKGKSALNQSCHQLRFTYCRIAQFDYIITAHYLICRVPEKAGTWVGDDILSLVTKYSKHHAQLPKIAERARQRPTPRN
jgi:hypothetical protein